MENNHVKSTSNEWNHRYSQSGRIETFERSFKKLAGSNFDSVSKHSSLLTLSKYLLLATLFKSRYRTAVDPSWEYIIAVNVLPGSQFENGSSCWLSVKWGNVTRAPGPEFHTEPSRFPSQGSLSLRVWERRWNDKTTFEQADFKATISPTLYPTHLKRSEDNFFDRGEIAFPQELSLLSELEDLLIGHGSHDIGNLCNRRKHSCEERCTNYRYEISDSCITWRRRRSSEKITACSQLMRSWNGRVHPLLRITGMHPARRASRKRKLPSLLPRGTRQKVEFINRIS